jgi:predicted transcriptional regulator
MAKTLIKDTRDIILEWLEAEERTLAWLSTKSTIPYGTLYSIFKQRTFDLNEERLKLINDGTNKSFTKDFN